MICFFNKYKKSVQKHTDFFDNSFFNAVPDKPLVTRNKPHNNQLCADLFHFISAYPVVSHFLRFAWQTTAVDKVCPVQKDDCLIVFFAVFIIVHTFPSVSFLVAVIIARVKGIVKQQKHRIFLNV